MGPDSTFYHGKMTQVISQCMKGLASTVIELFIINEMMILYPIC